MLSDPPFLSSALYRLRANVAPRGDAIPSAGTVFDLRTGCPVCGTGAEQVSSLRLRPSDLPKKRLFGQTYGHWLLFHDRVAVALRTRFDVKADLTAVEGKKSGERLPFWQVRPRFVMPRVAMETTGLILDEPCQRCQRDGHYVNNLLLAYRLDSASRRDLPPLAQTWECFGRSVREPRRERRPSGWVSLLAGFAVPLALARGDVCLELRRLIPSPLLIFEPVVLLE